MSTLHSFNFRLPFPSEITYNQVNGWIVFRSRYVGIPNGYQFTFAILSNILCNTQMHTIHFCSSPHNEINSWQASLIQQHNAICSPHYEIDIWQASLVQPLNDVCARQMISHNQILYKSPWWIKHPINQSISYTHAITLQQEAPDTFQQLQLMSISNWTAANDMYMF